MAQFSKLFQPGKIGTLELPNRMILASLGNHINDKNGYLTQRAIDYYVERVRGGVGLIVSGATNILHEYRFPGLSWLYDDSYIPLHKKLAEAVHNHGGLMFIQLNHNGMALSRFRVKLDDPESVDLIGPSPVRWVGTGMAPREATKKDIDHIAEGFAEATRRVKDAGFDGVELHAAHGYLLCDFLSPLTNRRTDEYGGSVENRARFACDVIRRIRQKVGPDFPLIMKISGSDFLPGGITIEDTVTQIPLFEEAGMDAITVSAASKDSTQWERPSYLFPSGTLVPLAEAVKKVANVPVIAVGKIGDPFLAEEILQGGKADFIALGRALLADPYLPIKAREGRFDDINYCIYCNNCESMGGRPETRKCTVNPSLFREREFAIKPAAKSKKVMVVGGGPAGLEAARTLAQRGHQVTLYEENGELGGYQWNLTRRQEYKAEFDKFTQYLIRGVQKAGVSVALNQEVTPELVKNEKPDAVVVATGASPAVPEVAGLEREIVVQADDVTAGKAQVGEQVVVVGGGFSGMEMAEYLAKKGKKVSLITRSRLGRNMGRNMYVTLRDMLIELGVHLYPNTPLEEIMDDGVYCVDGDHLLFLKADTVVLAVGIKPENRLLDELKGVVSEVYAAGDCDQPGDARDAIAKAAEVARMI